MNDPELNPPELDIPMTDPVATPMPAWMSEPIASLVSDRTEQVQETLQRYVALVVEGNKHVRLTGGRTAVEIWPHVEDAVRAAGALTDSEIAPSLTGKRIADIGSGAGFPGIVWAILFPEASVALVETTLKKSNFLQAAVTSLALTNATVHRARAEDLGRDPLHREKYDIACCRALGMLNVVAEWTTPLAAVGGHMVFIKGAYIDEEVAKARKPFEVLGGASTPIACPYETRDGRRSAVYVYPKIKSTERRYPRKGGKASRHPIS